MQLRRAAAFAGALALAVTAGAIAAPGGEAQVRFKRFRVTVTNLTDYQQFSPSVFATHNANISVWRPGETASFGVMRTAEEGNTGPLSTAVLVPEIGRTVGTVVPQTSILPGQTRTITITADSTHPLLSAIWMLVRTNDGFSGLSNLNLFELTKQTTYDLIAYDAGTEVNNEQAPYMITFEGTERQPEGSVITQHPNIRGDADAPAEWDFNNPVARVTITPVR